MISRKKILCMVKAANRSYKSWPGRLTVAEAALKLQEQGLTCALTGTPLTDENISLDHIRPKSDPLCSNTIQNIQFVTLEANRFKMDRPQWAIKILLADENMLYCGKCDKVKLRDEFSRDKQQASGRAGHCKECRREYQRGYMRTYYAKKKGVNSNRYEQELL